MLTIRRLEVFKACILEIPVTLTSYHTDNYVYGYRNQRQGSPIPNESDHWKRSLECKSALPYTWMLIQWYRNTGHIRSRKVNPLNQDSFLRTANLDEDFDRSKITDELKSPIGKHMFPDCHNFDSLIKQMNSVYCNDTTVELNHIRHPEQREWFAHNFEQRFKLYPINQSEQLRIARILAKGKSIDLLLAQKFGTVKRYGGEGAESMLVACDRLMRKSAQLGTDHLVITMPHRGRNNLLLALLNYPPRLYFRKMRGLGEFTEGSLATGDTFSHFFNSGQWTGPKLPEFGRSGLVNLHVSILPNPSHLEASMTYGLGKARGIMQRIKDGDYNESFNDGRNGDRVLCLQIHGDGSFSAQGIIMEALCLSGCPNYDVGGSVHLIVNNQLSYTTDHSHGSGFELITDVGKSLSSPIIHVNGECPESVARALSLAVSYRFRYRRDVFVNLVCYRRWGHNELDDPTFTQPVMYRDIVTRKPLSESYLDKLSTEGIEQSQIGKFVTEPLQKWNDYLMEELKRVEEPVQSNMTFKDRWAGFDPISSGMNEGIHIVQTGLPLEELRKICLQSIALPDDKFKIHTNLKRTFIDKRTHVADPQTPSNEKCIDWATGEALAFGSLLKDGIAVRLSGQDVGRGTFSQRHVMFVDQDTDDTWIPFNAVPLQENWARLEVANSPLSEAGVCGFEMGFAADHPNRLVLWELQFGDFFNGAQIQIDTYLGSMESKWYQQLGLVINLPHGMDGMGPEHSSCRLERWLQLSDSIEAPSESSYMGAKRVMDTDFVNLHIAVPTSPSQYFHLLRRQIQRPFRRPLIIVGPKLLLRLPAAFSSLDEFGPGIHFKHILNEDTLTDKRSIRTVILCSGKHFYELKAFRDKNISTEKAKQYAIVRIEQLTPFPILELAKELKSYSNATNFIWSQEEHRNMGAWNFVSTRLRNFIGLDLKYAGRSESACPAVGIGSMHQAEIKALMEETFKG